MVCGLRFENDMGTEVICGGEYDFWDEERVSTEKVTNLIVKHRFWEEVEKDIINATQEEVEKHGSE